MNKLEQKRLHAAMEKDPVMRGQATGFDSEGYMIDDYGRRVETLSMWQQEHNLKEELYAKVNEQTVRFIQDFVGWDDTAWYKKGDIITAEAIDHLYKEGLDLEIIKRILNKRLLAVIK